MNIEYVSLSSKDQWAMVNEALPILYVEDCTGLLAMDGDELVGAFVCDNWTETSVQSHFYVKHALVLKHDFLNVCFQYAFEHMGKKLMYGLVPGNNAAALKLNAHMGFTEKCRFENAFSENVDYVIMQLKKEDCKYLAPIAEVA